MVIYTNCDEGKLSLHGKFMVKLKIKFTKQG